MIAIIRPLIERVGGSSAPFCGIEFRR